MSDWQTVWACVILTGCVLALDAWLASRCGLSGHKRELLARREARKIHTQSQFSEKNP